eukprot:gb/GECG01014567.1/.p1 GENE.gb/GECG01014567.1/~~gb/GECG01014567.1/.p1  ORF type:complete len:537 (+),score=59.70 gb/GECG01014567.1/:1-1611(+)
MEGSDDHGYSRNRQPIPSESRLSRTWSKLSDSTSYSTAVPVEPSPIHLGRTYSSRKFNLSSSSSFRAEKEGPEPRSKLNSSNSSHYALANLFDISRPAYFPRNDKRQRSGHNLSFIEEESVESGSSYHGGTRRSSVGDSDAIASPIEHIFDDIQRNTPTTASSTYQMKEDDLRSAIDKRIRWHQKRKKHRRSSLPDAHNLGKEHRENTNRRRRHSITSPSRVGTGTSGELPSKESRFEMHTLSSEAKYRPERRVLPKHHSSENIRQLELKLSSPENSQPSDWLKSPPFGTMNHTGRKIETGGGYSPSTTWSSSEKHAAANYWNRLAKSVGLGRQSTQAGSYRRLPVRRDDIQIRSRLKGEPSADELNESARLRFMQPTYSWSKQVKDAANVKERHRWVGKWAASPESRRALYKATPSGERNVLGMSPKQYDHLESASHRAVDESNSGGCSDRQSFTIASNVSVIDGDSASDQTPNWLGTTDCGNAEEEHHTDQDTATLEKSLDNRTEIEKLLGSFRDSLQTADQHTSRLANSFYGR